MNNEAIIEELNSLIQLDFDASKTYEQALEHVDDEQARLDLQAFLSDHLRHIADLSRVVATLGGEAIEPNRDIKGVLLEGMTKLRSVTGTVGALKAMRMNEKLTNRSYDRASELELPPGARDVVLANLADERRHLATIQAHIARLDDSDEDVDEDVDRDQRGPEDRSAVDVGDVSRGDVHTGVRI